MNRNESSLSTRGHSQEGDRREARRSLVCRPLLIGLSLLSLLTATTVSAGGRGERFEHADVREIKEHVAHRVDHILEKIDASDAQKDAIQAIVSGGIDELHALHADFASRRDEIGSLLTAEAIDRKAIEAFRASHVAHADAMSRIVSERLADVMVVLTPEQRRALQARLDRHHARRWGRGHRFGAHTRD